METPEEETLKDIPKLEWDSLGKLPLDAKIDGLLIRNEMIAENQFLEQRFTTVLERLGKQQEVVSERVGSIILTRAENHERNSAEIYVTKLELKRKRGELLLVPEDRLHTDQSRSEYHPKEILETLTADNGLFFVVDER